MDMRSTYLLLLTGNIIIVQLGALHALLDKKITFLIASDKDVFEEILQECPDRKVQLLRFEGKLPCDIGPHSTHLM